MTVKMEACGRSSHLFLQPSGLTLNDVDGKGLRDPLHPVDPGRADVVSVEAGVEAVDEDALALVDCEVHSWWHSGAVVHAEPQVCG